MRHRRTLAISTVTIVLAIVSPAKEGSMISLFLNNGGRFREKADHTFPVPGVTKPTKLRVRNLNNDDLPDFLVTRAASTSAPPCSHWKGLGFRPADPNPRFRLTQKTWWKVRLSLASLSSARLVRQQWLDAQPQHTAEHLDSLSFYSRAAVGLLPANAAHRFGDRQR